METRTGRKIQKSEGMKRRNTTKYSRPERYSVTRKSLSKPAERQQAPMSLDFILNNFQKSLVDMLDEQQILDRLR